MGKGDILQQYRSMSREDQLAFNRWLKANAVIGLIVSIGLVAMALVGAHSARSPDAAVAASEQKPAALTTR